MNKINNHCTCGRYFILYYCGNLEEYLEKHPEKDYCEKCRKENKQSIIINNEIEKDKQEQIAREFNIKKGRVELAKELEKIWNEFFIYLSIILILFLIGESYSYYVLYEKIKNICDIKENQRLLKFYLQENELTCVIESLNNYYPEKFYYKIVKEDY